MKRKEIYILLCGMFLLVFGYGCAQVIDTVTATQLKLAGSNVFVSGTTLSMSITALDQDNVRIGNLGAGNLSGKIYNSNPLVSGMTAATTQQAVATLAFTSMSSGGTKLVSGALVIDKSGSMGVTKLESAEVAAREFVSSEAAASASNKASVVLFDDHVSIEAEMRALSSSDVATINDAINIRNGYGGSTALYYAISRGIIEASKESVSSNLTRAVIALTDGGENASPDPYSGTGGTTEVINLAINSGIPVYTVGLFSTTTEASNYSSALKSIARETTGSQDNYFEVIVGGAEDLSVSSNSRIRALASLSTLYQNLANALINSYSVSATLSNSLSAGNYWMVLTVQNYGGFSGQEIVVPFVVR
ncbi:MAG: vWA domain-containing protein [Candidatus Margulisiibacteriota bacterium]